MQSRECTYKQASEHAACKAVVVKKPLVAQMLRSPPAVQETQVQSLGQEDPLDKSRQPTLVFLPGEFHGQRSLVGYSPWGREESGKTELLTL